jgi:two-component system cell cycle sensor histidine kinase/response regulator CckA
MHGPSSTASPRRGPSVAGEGDRCPGPQRGSIARWTLWIPAVYAVASALWILFSDILIATTPGSARAHAVISIAKGFGFVAVTAGLLHAGLRWASARERATLWRVEASEGLLRAVIDAIPDPVFVKDRESRWLYANPATLETLGKSLAQTIGKSDREIYDDASVSEALTAADRRVIDSGVAQTIEETVQTPDGYRVFQSAKAPLRDPDGQVIGIVGNARDVSERRRAAEALAERERYLATVLQTALDGYIAVDPAGRIGEVNEAYCEMVGYTRDELLGMSVAGLDASEAGREMAARIERITALGLDRFETQHRRKDGGVIDVECSVRRLPERGGTFVCFIRDVTHEKRAREALRRSEEQFRQAQKLESVGRLAGGVAHDFNNLLTVILSCSEAMRRELAAGEVPSLEDVKEIHAAGERARDLTQQLLAFARKQMIAPQPMHLGDTVRASEKILRRLLGEDVDLQVRLEPSPWSVLCDPGQIEQIILNLAVNARDAMPAGGTLVIEASNVAIGDADVLLAAFPGATPGDYVRLAVEDTGTGMSPEVQERLFEPFFTTKDVGKGTGLGLATVYGIVKQSHGHLRVESRLGQGTRFELLFPRTANDQPDLSAPAGRRPADGHGTETVLLVDDDPGIRKVGIRALQAGGYRVLEAVGAADAIALVQREARPPDLVVTDVVMPGRDGSKLAAELLRTHPELRVLYVSGYTRDVVAERGLLDSGIHFLQKPFTAATLLDRVRAVLDA